jgi:bifunctional UDP-N-acetylglucosamine pyrophosphorylase/glucosamine-1-phosphate N-acetyltransferase
VTASATKKRSVSRAADAPAGRFSAVILAAGRGKRMRSKTVKVLHPLAGRPMLLYPIIAAVEAGADPIAVVIGSRQQEVLRQHLKPYPVVPVVQPEPLGTGHAVLQARDALKGRAGPVLILSGDVPLIPADLIRRLFEDHTRHGGLLTFMTAQLPNPYGYGRVIRGRMGEVERIVEERDLRPEQKAISEINAGVYMVQPDFLFETLPMVGRRNAQKEYYLTDLVAAAAERKGARPFPAPDPELALGINTRAELALAERRMRDRIADRLMEEGATLLDPATTWIEAGVRIGEDTVIYPNTRLEGATEIGRDCVIRSFTTVRDARIGNGVTVKESCVITESVIEDGASAGPFAHLRPGTVLRRKARVGNFVEVKKSEIGEGSKANHLTYLGDATVGRDANIGAGTITCNYDGFAKHTTVIEDRVFVGSDTQLVAPVRVGRGAVVAAGSTVTKDVPAEALAISRPEQVNKPGWAKNRRTAQKRKAD